jgi:hypothetical protein
MALQDGNGSGNPVRGLNETRNTPARRIGEPPRRVGDSVPGSARRKAEKNRCRAKKPPSGGELSGTRPVNSGCGGESRKRRVRQCGRGVPGIRQAAGFHKLRKRRSKYRKSSPPTRPVPGAAGSGDESAPRSAGSRGGRTAGWTAAGPAFSGPKALTPVGKPTGKGCGKGLETARTWRMSCAKYSYTRPRQAGKAGNETAPIASGADSRERPARIPRTRYVAGKRGPSHGMAARTFKAPLDAGAVAWPQQTGSAKASGRSRADAGRQARARPRPFRSRPPQLATPLGAGMFAGSSQKPAPT